MSKFLGLREEHMDLFGTLANGSYTSALTFTSSTDEVKGNVIQRMAKDIAHWRAKAVTTVAAPAGTTMTATIYASNALSNGALTSPVAVFTVAGVDVTGAGKWILDCTIPTGYQYYQVGLTPSKAATGCVVEGFMEPEFN